MVREPVASARVTIILPHESYKSTGEKRGRNVSERFQKPDLDGPSRACSQSSPEKRALASYKIIRPNTCPCSSAEFLFPVICTRGAIKPEDGPGRRKGMSRGYALSHRPKTERPPSIPRCSLTVPFVVSSSTEPTRPFTVSFLLFLSSLSLSLSIFLYCSLSFSSLMLSYRDRRKLLFLFFLSFSFSFFLFFLKLSRTEREGGFIERFTDNFR